jgi:hypothetical protein
MTVDAGVEKSVVLLRSLLSQSASRYRDVDSRHQGRSPCSKNLIGWEDNKVEAGVGIVAMRT